MKEIILSITPQLYTIKEAAKLLKTDNNPSEFYRNHIQNGLRVTVMPGGKRRISSIELARYIQFLTIEE